MLLLHGNVVGNVWPEIAERQGCYCSDLGQWAYELRCVNAAFIEAQFW